MLDVRLFRQEPDRVREGLAAKGADPGLVDRVLAVDAAWREAVREAESLRSERNRVSEEIGRLRREGRDDTGPRERVRSLGERLAELEQEERRRQEELRSLLLAVPNLPAPGVPPGRDESGNVEVRRRGEPPAFAFAPRPHWELGADLGILDFERAGKISGSRFTVFRGAGARLCRALIGFMLDLHRERGYEEVYPPFLVNSASMTGTGQLPKFAADAFRLADRDLWLVPTAEVPVTNLYRDEILPGEALPIRHCSYTACFRSEAGAAGRDTRGLVRQHQFDKVELVWFTRPEEAAGALETLVEDAAEVLRRLGLPYRVVEMCAGDLGFAAARKYDLEVWLPSYGRYVEISSCSNFGDFQARRANIRFRRERGARPEFVHTLNGSGLAVGRTLAAILENGQREDGTVVVPEALVPRLGVERITGPGA